MFEILKRLFTSKGPASRAEEGLDLPPQRFSDEEYERFGELESAALRRVLGPLHPTVWHAIIGFQVGGPVDMYLFPDALPGTGFATMELLEPDGTGPLPSRIGTYELVAFTRHAIVSGDEGFTTPFSRALLRLRSILSRIGHFSFEAVLNPMETCEVPGEGDEEEHCVIFDEYCNPDAGFTIGSRRHGLLLVVEVFRSEMEYAMENGTAALVQRLRQAGHYPYSDLDRPPVA